MKTTEDHAAETWLRVGDVIRHDNKEYIVDMVNESRARCTNLSDRGNQVSIATSVERGTILERCGQAGLNNFLASRTKRGATTETSTEGEVMGKSKKPKTEKKRARGGLAAAIRDKNEAEANGNGATKAPKTKKSRTPNADGKKSAKAFIEELLNGGKTTKEEAVALVVADYGVTEKAAKGAVNNARHYQKKENRTVGEWKKAKKPEAETATA